MDVSADIGIYTVAGALVFLVLWRHVILKAIAYFNPKLFIKINRLTAPITVDDALKRIDSVEQKKVEKEYGE